jgi:hypothetical protein
MLAIGLLLNDRTDAPARQMLGAAPLAAAMATARLELGRVHARGASAPDSPLAGASAAPVMAGRKP